MTDFYKIVGALRKRIEGEHHKCQAIGCPQKVRTRAMFCERHFRMLPEGLRTTLNEGSAGSRDEKLERAMDILHEMESRGRDA